MATLPQFLDTTGKPYNIPGATPVSQEPVIPPTATTVNMLLSKAWSCKHDTGTPGNASGIYSYPVTAPDKTPLCAEFNSTMTALGGALYHANVLANASAFNTFCLETVEYYPVAPTEVATMENDLEQVGAATSGGNGPYVDMAMQLDHYSGTVDITQNGKWVPTSVKADPAKRLAGVWYTTREYFKNIDGTNVLYMGVFLSDTGLYAVLDITVPSRPSALWGALLLNQQKQYVSLSSGTVNFVAYVKTLNIHCWKS